jgi:hypothetical protein
VRLGDVLRGLIVIHLSVGHTGRDRSEHGHDRDAEEAVDDAVLIWRDAFAFPPADHRAIVGGGAGWRTRSAGLRVRTLDLCEERVGETGELGLAELDLVSDPIPPLDT